MSTRTVVLSEETIQQIARTVVEVFRAAHTPGTKSKCFCGRCHNCRSRNFEARKRARLRAEREAAAKTR